MAKIYLKRNEIEADVKDILLEVIVTLDEKDIRPEAKLVEDLGADSLDIVDITMHMEKTFGVDISDYLMEEMKDSTFSQLCDMIERITK